MTSRLDRLFILLESGSSPVTRRAAAKQIGEVQKLHPHELHNLLSRLLVYLHSPVWDTRIAAAQAAEAILQNVPQWNPKPSAVKTEFSSSRNYEASRLTFDLFNLATVLEKGARLIGSEGTEFDCTDDTNNLDELQNGSEHDRLQRQRMQLNEKLGLCQSANSFGLLNINDLVSLDDMRNTSNKYEPNKSLLPVQEVLNLETNPTTTTTTLASSMSCRELNRLRRKSRQQFINTTSATTTVTNNVTTLNTGTSSSAITSMSATFSRSNSTSNGSLSDEQPDIKKIKLNDIDGGCSISESVPDSIGEWADATTDWPLESFCSKLYLDLFNPRWETRHGAATALRELFKTHATGAGKSVYMTANEMEQSHIKWLEDAVLRLLCVLALDRFGDFISDQVVAPVRETCAQVLGIALKEMPTNVVKSTVDILIRLMKQNEWEVRHGGMLGIKYMLVVREDLMQTFLPTTVNNILAGLFDPVDDVGAVAASTLIPIASSLPKLLSLDQVSSIVKMLWDLLLDQDELTSACNSFMGLLSAILSLPNASQWLQMESMTVLIPRLWPFLCHTTSSVRRSTLQTLKTLTQCNISSPPANGSKDEKIDDVKLKLSEQTAKDINKIVNVDAKSLSLNFGVKEWPPTLLQESLRHIFQRVLVEHVPDIQSIAEEVWVNLVTNAELSALLHAACPYVSSWMCLAMQPARLAFDQSLMIFARTSPTKERTKRNSDLDVSNSEKSHPKLYLGGVETTPIDIREKNIPRARCIAAKMIGLLSKYLILPAPGVVYTPEMESPIQCYIKLLIGYLSSRSALQRLISGMVISFWAVNDPSSRPGPKVLQEKLKTVLTEFVYYDEVAFLLTRLLQESRDFIATMKQYKVPFTDFDSFNILTIDQIQALSTTHTENLQQKYPFLKAKIATLLEERRCSLQQSLAQTNHEQNILNVSTLAIIAGATVNLECIPDLVNPVVKPLMESIKRERCQIIQQLAAQYLVKLLDLVRNRNPNPINKIVINLCHLLKSDNEFTPRIIKTEKRLKDFDPNQEDKKNPYHGVLTLTIQSKGAENQSATIPRGPGRPPVIDISIDDMVDIDDPCREQNRIQRIGAQFAVQAICAYFGKDLVENVPIFWNLLKETIKTTEEDIKAYYVTDGLATPVNFDQANELILCLQLIECATASVHPSLSDELLDLLPKLSRLLKHPLRAIRHMTSRCLATLALMNSSCVMDLIVKETLVQLQTIENVIYRQGAVEAISCIVNKLQFEIVPYVLLLIVPLLGQMSDPDKTVRLLSTHCFATLIQLMPLDNPANDQKSSLLSLDLRVRKSKDEEFLECLIHPKKIPNYHIPVPIDAELRSYQQSGVNWLWFLNKYKLHGILADDMGLGKTLQAICILAGDHHERKMKKESNLPSLVICPPTLTGHWVYEVNKFVSNEYLKPLHYVGFPNEREKLRPKVSLHNLVVASYDIVRKDITFFSQIHWNYVILDEGHIIKNGKTKCSQAMKQLIANHRLILSGTPIQNNVLELWSLFDFLMPGFLGTEKQFCTKFSRPILASRDAKSSPKDQEAGALAMEALHRQVLPFILRRVKEDVLTDLPPKITQDLLCELSPLQERLYEDFSRTHLSSDDLNECLETIDRSTNTDGSAIVRKTHIFQALRYLQNVCNHPKLVLTKEHPEYQCIQDELAKSNKSFNDIDNAAKLPALKQLLLDCGIGNETSNGDPLISVNQHRALIFCQLKAMLNIVENDLLKKHMPAVSYLRLDGSIPAASRHQIVTKFNSDPSIDVLLLTTQVGGLGLNLTGADTVIFVEHDWNPMKDLQAMDRAHRIGQKKVVNVYRLITRKSLEEKIMGLQKFKLLTANTIVSEQNASMETMGTEHLFDLFTLSNNGSDSKQINGNDSKTSVTLKQAIENLPELWEDKEYEEEYDMTQFIKTLKS